MDNIDHGVFRFMQDKPERAISTADDGVPASANYSVEVVAVALRDVPNEDREDLGYDRGIT